MFVEFQATAYGPDDCVTVLEDPLNVGQVGFVVDAIEVNGTRLKCVFLFRPDERELMMERVKIFTDNPNSLVKFSAKGELVGTCSVLISEWSLDHGPIRQGYQTKLRDITTYAAYSGDFQATRIPDLPEQYETNQLAIVARIMMNKTGLSFDELAEKARLEIIDLESY